MWVSYHLMFTLVFLLIVLQVPYPLISLVTRLPQTLQGHCPLTFHCRTFETFTITFGKDTDALDVFESVKELTVASTPSFPVRSNVHADFLGLASVTQLYAFYYSPNPPLSVNDGWSLYSVREEFGRMGVGTRTKAWRFTDINKDYSVGDANLTWVISKLTLRSAMSNISCTPGGSDQD